MEKLKEGEDVVGIFEEILELELHEYQKKQLAMLLIGNTLTDKSAIDISDMFKYYADVEEVPDEKTN
tara:strand:- start:4521 stop:4721 length:201 start_codon:yes stop_codon:yes gene_type:complete